MHVDQWSIRQRPTNQIAGNGFKFATRHWRQRLIVNHALRDVLSFSWMCLLCGLSLSVVFHYIFTCSMVVAFYVLIGSYMPNFVILKVH